MPDKSVPDEEPKLIIDEDWKSQVQREKEELKQKLAEKQVSAEHSDDQASESSPTKTPESFADSEEVRATASTPASDEASSAKDDSHKKQLEAPPPASMMLLVTTLATQAMGAMGLMPDEQGEPLPVHLDFARHFIDMLAVLEAKTKGNLSDEEQRYLGDALHQLRMAFVAVSKKSSGAP